MSTMVPEPSDNQAEITDDEERRHREALAGFPGYCCVKNAACTHMCSKPAGHTGDHVGLEMPTVVIDEGHDARPAGYCEHPLGFIYFGPYPGVLRCPDCKEECPGDCVCGAPYLSQLCAGRSHTGGALLKDATPW